MKRFLCAIVLFTAFLALAAPPDSYVRNPIDTAAPAPMTNIVKAIAAEMAATNATLNLPDFTIVQMGDLQDCAATATGRQYVTNSFSYLIAMKSALNIKALVLPGDLTDDGTDETMWLFITNQLARLYAAGIPFYASAGNHDKYGGSHIAWNNHMAAFMAAQPGYESRLSASDYYAASWFQTNSGLKLNFIALGYATNATDFANIAAFGANTASNNADHISIFLTHGYLSTDSIPLFTPDTGYDSGINGIDWWSNCFKIIPSSAQVLCGHDHPGTFARLTQYNDWGTRVDSVLFNEQDSANGGGNYIRFYRWQPNHNWILAYTVDTTATNVLTSAGSYFLLPITGVYPGGDFASTNWVNSISNKLQGDIDGLIVGGVTEGAVVALGFLRTNDDRGFTLTGSNDFSITPSFGQTIGFRGSVGAGDGKILVLDQSTTTKQVQTASGMGATNQNLWVNKGVTAGFFIGPSTNQSITTPIFYGDETFTDAGDTLDRAYVGLLDDGAGSGMFTISGDATPILVVQGSAVVSNQVGTFVPFRINIAGGHQTNIMEVTADGTNRFWIGSGGLLHTRQTLQLDGLIGTSAGKVAVLDDVTHQLGVATGVSATNGDVYANKFISPFGQAGYLGKTASGALTNDAGSRVAFLSDVTGVGTGIETNGGTGINNTFTNLTEWGTTTTHGTKNHDGTDNFQGAFRAYTGSMVATNPLFYRDAAAGDTNAIRLSGGMTATFFNTPTNSPTDGQVVTASGTSGATKWATVSSGTGSSNITDNAFTAEIRNATVKTNLTVEGSFDANQLNIGTLVVTNGIVGSWGQSFEGLIESGKMTNAAGSRVAYQSDLVGVDPWATQFGSSVLTNWAGIAAFGNTNKIPAINVLDYGAKGDNVTDDTAAIQAAIDAAVPKRQKVFVPAGIYVINGTLYGRGGVTVEGESCTYEGTSGTRLRKPSGVAGPIMMLPLGNFTLRNIYWSGASRDPAYQTTGQYGLVSTNDYRRYGDPDNGPTTTQGLIENCRFDTFSAGVFLHNAWGIVLNEPYFTACYDGLLCSNTFTTIRVFGGSLNSNTNAIHLTGGGYADSIYLETTVESCERGLLIDNMADALLDDVMLSKTYMGDNVTSLDVTNTIGLKVLGGHYVSTSTNMIFRGVNYRPELNPAYISAPVGTALLHADSGTVNVHIGNQYENTLAPKIILGPSSQENRTDFVQRGGNIRTDGNISAAGMTNTSLTSQTGVATDANGKLIAQVQAGNETAGWLSAVDWNTFNNKMAVGAALTAAQVSNAIPAIITNYPSALLRTNNFNGVPTPGLAVPMVQGTATNVPAWTNLGTAAFSATTAFDAAGVSIASTNHIVLSAGTLKTSATVTNLTQRDSTTDRTLVFDSNGLTQTNPGTLTGRTFKDGQLGFWYNGTQTATVDSTNGLANFRSYTTPTNTLPYYTTIDTKKGYQFVSTNAAFTIAFDALPTINQASVSQGLIELTNSASSGSYVLTIGGVNAQASVTCGVTNGQRTFVAWLRTPWATNVCAWDTFKAILK